MINPNKFKIVLIGTSKYSDDNEKFCNIPCIHGNLSALKDIFRNDEIIGVPEENIKILLDTPNWEMQLELEKFVVELDPNDVLLVYYSGHGVRSRDGLYLTATNSIRNLISTQINFKNFQKLLNETAARLKILLLDCCYSGLATNSMSDAESYTQAQLEDSILEGAFILASSPPNEVSLFNKDNPYTIFTGELIKCLSEGIPIDQEFLSLNDLYKYLLLEFRKKKVKDTIFEPQKKDNLNGELFIAKNLKYNKTYHENVSTSPNSNKYNIVTGALGTYRLIGEDIANVMEGTVNIEYSKGSVDNLKKITKDPNKNILTIVQEDVLGSNILSNYENKILVIMPLYNEEFHLISRKSSNIKSLSDLTNKIIAIDDEDSGSNFTANNIKNILNIDWHTSYRFLDEALVALRSRQIDAVFNVNGGALSQFDRIPKSASNILSLVPLQNIELDSHYEKAILPCKTYDWQKEDVETYHVRTVLVSYNYPTESEQYKQLKNIITRLLSNLKLLKEFTGHPKWSKVEISNKGDNKDNIHPVYFDALKELIN